MEDEDRVVPQLSPKDIFGPIATLSGLLIASIGFIHASNLSTSITQALTDIILVILLLFVVTAGSASFYTKSGKEKYWSLALFFYPISWMALGIGISVMLTLVAYGPTIFVTLTVPPVIILSALTLGISIVLAALTYYTGYNRYNKKLKELETKEGQKISSKQKSETSKGLSTRNNDNIKMNFLRGFIEIESILRDMFQTIFPDEKSAQLTFKQMVRKLSTSNMFDKDFIPALEFLNGMRNNIVHGFAVPISHVEEAIRICSTVSDELKDDLYRLKSNYGRPEE